MAKKKQNQLPPSKGKSTKGGPPVETPVATPVEGRDTESVIVEVAEQLKASVEIEKPEVASNVVPIENVGIPVAPEVVGFTTRQLSIKGLTIQQRANLQRIKNGLVSQKATLANGTPVMRESSAIRWLLEQVG